MDYWNLNKLGRDLNAIADLIEEIDGTEFSYEDIGAGFKAVLAFLSDPLHCSLLR